MNYGIDWRNKRKLFFSYTRLPLQRVNNIQLGRQSNAFARLRKDKNDSKVLSQIEKES